MTEPTESLARRRRTSRRGHQGCPMCGKATLHRFRPFCSRRCQQLDLGRWLDGSYAIPAEEAPQPDAPETSADSPLLQQADPADSSDQ